MIAGQLLGFDNFIPPYRNATGQEITTGVNYGRGGAVIRDGTGINLVTTSSFIFSAVNIHFKHSSHIIYHSPFSIFTSKVKI